MRTIPKQLRPILWNALPIGLLALCRVAANWQKSAMTVALVTVVALAGMELTTMLGRTM